MSPPPPPSQSSGKGREQRRHPRRPEGRPAWLQWGGTTIGVSMVDISDGGACLISPRPLSKGRPVKLQVGHGAGSVMTDGVVVRSAERHDGGYDVGVQFTDGERFAAACRFSSRVVKAAG